MKSDTSERGLEQLICAALTGSACDPAAARTDSEREVPVAIGGAGWICGDPNDYDREYTVDLAQLLAFLIETQPDAFDGLNLSEDGPTRRKFLAGCRARSASAASSTCCARASSTGRTTSTCSTARRRRATRRPTERYAAEPLQRHAPAPLQPRRDAARARPRPVHQRPADRDLRAEEQPDQADGRRRRRAVQARPRPAREALRVRPLRRALRGGRQRGALLHAS